MGERRGGAPIDCDCVSAGAEGCSDAGESNGGAGDRDARPGGGGGADVDAEPAADGCNVSIK